MGRITPSFRQKFHEKIWELRKKLRDTCLDDEMKAAFENLVRAWSSEGHALAEAYYECVHYVQDVINLMSNVHNRKCILEIERTISKLEKTIQVYENEMLEKELKKLKF